MLSFIRELRNRLPVGLKTTFKNDLDVLFGCLNKVKIVTRFGFGLHRTIKKSNRRVSDKILKWKLEKRHLYIWPPFPFMELFTAYSPHMAILYGLMR